MKKIIMSLLLAGCLVAPVTIGCASGVQATGSAEVGNLAAQADVQLVTASFLGSHKKEVFLLAAAITVALSLKYCSWMRGLVGLDTEDEISDLREFIQ